MVASHHRSLPMLTVHFYHKKNLLHNVKSTRWIITNKIIYGSSNAERKGDNSSVLHTAYLYMCKLGNKEHVLIGSQAQLPS